MTKIREVKCRNCGGTGTAKTRYGYQLECNVCCGFGKVASLNTIHRQRR